MVKMFRVLLVCVFLCASAAIRAEAEIPVTPLLNYHEEIGVPLAKRIQEAEEAYWKSLENSEQALDDGRIVGGAISSIYNHPFLGGLLINFSHLTGRSACGSSLLTANRLVTAAHCLLSSTWAWQIEVVLGSQFLFSGGTRVFTSSYVLHPQYIPSTLENDVAMLLLPTTVALTQAIQPVALPSGALMWENFAGWWSNAAGYGLTNDWETGISQATQVSQVNLNVITQAACTQVFTATFIKDSTLCTSGVGGVGICGGDSGGPLVANINGQNVLIGISSFRAGTGCAAGHPSGFARVTSFLPFILQYL